MAPGSPTVLEADEPARPKAALWPLSVLGFVACAVGAACIGQAGGDGLSGSLQSQGGNGEDGGNPAPPIASGATVTWLETRAPDDPEFVLRGTIPVPPGIFPRSDEMGAFTVLDFDGNPVETQTETASLYPADADGADIVEVLARVRRDPNAQIGSQVRYEVRNATRAARPAPGTPGIDDLLVGTVGLPPIVQSLLANPTAIKISAYDCFGNEYVAYPLDGTGFHRLMRYGAVQTELRVYQTMVPAVPVSGAQGTLPHFFGVHAYISSFTGEEIVGFDLRLHNGHSGNDKTSPLDDPLDKLYFQRIDVSMPDAWTLEQDFRDPMFGASVVSNGRRIVSLVEPNSDGTMHIMRWQGQLHRRLMLATAGYGPLARSYLAEGTGSGFCVRGTDPVGGHEYWSWWNRGTARYFPQRYQLPSLDHIGGPNLRGALQSTYAWISGHLINGTGDGIYPIVVGNLGWAHPYGVAYGGMTSGNEIFISDGVETAASASTQGLVVYRATHRMHTDRQWTALYNLDGEPSCPDDWVINGSNGPYIPFEHFLHPDLSAGDPFGVSSAPQFQIQHVEGTGLQPSYFATYMGYDAHDYQHFIRYTRSAKVLVTLANDSLAKDDLRMQAETFHLSYHVYANSSGGGTQGSGLKSSQQFVAQFPGVGLSFGRGPAWGVDCAAAAFSTSSSAWRAQKRPWLEDIAELLAEGQGACNGFIQAQVSGKFFNGMYRARQEIEQAITENMLQGLRESVFRGADQARSDLVKDVLEDSLYAFISLMAWPPGLTAPATHSAVGPLDPGLGVWCSFTSMPTGGWTGMETYQNWSSFAYAYELSGDSIFLDKATLEIGGGDLLMQLESAGTNNIQNRASLVALMQRLGGKL